MYIKVLLVLSGYISGDAGVAGRVRHLSESDLNRAAVGRYGNVVVRTQDLWLEEK